MTIYDLMLNDLVLYKGHVKKVVGIKRSYDLIDLAINDKDFFTCSVTDIEPIELTPDILNGFGFSDRGAAGYQRRADEMCPKHLTYYYSENSLGVGFPFIDEHFEIISGIEYLHIFQHVLRIFGFREFADNLKIIHRKECKVIPLNAKR